MSRSGQLNFTEETVKVVVSLGEDPKNRGLVRPLLEQLERRMRLLVERDFRSAVACLEARCGDELDRFFDLVGQEEFEDVGSEGEAEAATPAMKPITKSPSVPMMTPREKSVNKISKRQARKAEMAKLILAGVLKALLNHADEVVSSVLQGSIEIDDHNEPIIDPVTQRPRMRERSGIMVRVDEPLVCRQDVSSSRGFCQKSRQGKSQRSPHVIPSSSLGSPCNLPVAKEHNISRTLALDAPFQVQQQREPVLAVAIHKAASIRQTDS